MMNRHNVNKITLAGLFVVLGLALPFATSHAFRIPGTMLLPMHIPVLICGLVCGPRLGALCGILTPLLSSLLTGMPAPFPMLPALMGELTLYGFLSGWGYRSKNKSVFASLIPAIAAGRIANGLILAAMLGFSAGTLRLAAGFYSVLSGLPGIALQLILVPIALRFIEKNELIPTAKAKSFKMPEERLKEARRLIDSGEYSCVVIRGGEIIHKADGRGVSPLLHLCREEPEKLRDSLVIDRVIGKAGAMILQRGGVGAVFGELLSKSADAFLTEYGIPHGCGRCIDVVINREGNGICPIERSVLHTDDPEEGYRAIVETVNKLMAAKAKRQEAAS